MDKEIDSLSKLISEVLHPFSVVVTEKIERKVVCCEITLKFRSADEIEKLIEKLNLLRVRT